MSSFSNLKLNYFAMVFTIEGGQSLSMTSAGLAFGCGAGDTRWTVSCRSLSQGLIVAMSSAYIS